MTTRIVSVLQSLLFALSAAASGTLGSPAPQIPTIKIDVSLVTVGVRVTDDRGREVAGLGAADFSLYEDGVPQRISMFSSEVQPISLGILLDRSDSMEEAHKFDRAKAAAQLLVDAGHPSSEYLYVAFDGWWTDATFTLDRERVKREIAATQLGKGTRLYSTLIYALGRCKNAMHARQVLVIITDGTDQHSARTLDEVIVGLQESQVQLYAIGYFSGPEDTFYRNSGPRVALQNLLMVDNPRTVFKRLATESGAEAFFPRSDAELQAAVEKIAKDLRTQYTLAFYPTNPLPDNRYRRLQVKLKPVGLRVRARQGYRLQPARGTR